MIFFHKFTVVGLILKLTVITTFFRGVVAHFPDLYSFFHNCDLFDRIHSLIVISPFLNFVFNWQGHGN